MAALITSARQLEGIYDKGENGQALLERYRIRKEFGARNEAHLFKTSFVPTREEYTELRMK